jgi:hypothetical protein
MPAGTSRIALDGAHRALQNVSCLYGALGLGRHRHAGPDFQSSLLAYECPRIGASRDTCMKRLLASCTEYKQVAFRAAKEER